MYIKFKYRKFIFLKIIHSLYSNVHANNKKLNDLYKFIKIYHLKSERKSKESYFAILLLIKLEPKNKRSISNGIHFSSVFKFTKLFISTSMSKEEEKKTKRSTKILFFLKNYFPCTIHSFGFIEGFLRGTNFFFTFFGNFFYF